MTLSLEQQQQKQCHNLIIQSQTKKCSICNRINVLMKLPQEFQEFSKQKNFESWFCGNCIQIINFIAE